MTPPPRHPRPANTQPRRRAGAFGPGAALACLMWALTLHAWTTPVNISTIQASNAKVTRGAGGAAHVAWQTHNYEIRYRHRNGSGAWGPVETISTFFSYRPDVITDGAGRPHIVFAGTGAGDRADLYHTYKSGGSWTPLLQLTATSAANEDTPRMDVDSTGRVHLVHHRGNSLRYRVWNGPAAGWSAETDLGLAGDPYYHRSDISVDANDNIHVTYSTGTTLYYRRFNGLSWSGPAVLGTTTAFFAFPKIAAASPANVVIVLFDELGNGLRYTASTNGGASWTPLQSLINGHWPNMDAAAGRAHLVYHRLSTKTTNYMSWNGAAWTPTQPVADPTEFQVWTDVAVGSDGIIHVVYDDFRGEPNGQKISYVASIGLPPAPASGFAATGGHNVVRLNWTNPIDPHFQRTMLRFSTTGLPQSPSDGSLLANLSNPPGTSDRFDHTGVTNGATYYYAAFACSVDNHCSFGTTAAATPFVPADIDRDGDVDQEDFGLLQRCLGGPAVTPPAGCENADLDGDGDVDFADFELMFGCFSGAGVPYTPSCAG